jgi:hypothetical protein
MPRVLFIVTVLVVALAAFGCGDGDDGDSGDPSVTAAPTSEQTGTVTPGPTGGTGTGTQPAGSGSPTVQPSAPAGTPATEPTDANAFLDQFEGKHVEFRACAYNPVTALVNCADFGVFSISPPITGQDITCQLWEVEQKPAAIQCQSAEPLQTRYYALQ